MKRNTWFFVFVFFLVALAFLGCKDDDPTGPGDNNPVDVDPDTPDYSVFRTCSFSFDAEITKQYSSHSIVEGWGMGGPYYGFKYGSCSGGVYYSDTTIWGQYEQVTVEFDTTSGAMSNLEYHYQSYGEDNAIEITIVISGMGRNHRTVNEGGDLRYEEHGTACNNYLTSIDYSWDDYDMPTESFHVTNHSCNEESDLIVYLSEHF